MRGSVSTASVAWKGIYSKLLNHTVGANHAFAPAGIQFWVKSLEAVHTPRLANMNPYELKSWLDVKADILKIFPSVPSSEWADSQQQYPMPWLRAVGTKFAAQANPEELIIWIVGDILPGIACCSYFPTSGRGVFIRRGTFESAMSNTLGHEIGHQLGMNHTYIQQSEAVHGVQSWGCG